MEFHAPVSSKGKSASNEQSSGSRQRRRRGKFIVQRVEWAARNASTIHSAHLREARLHPLLCQRGPRRKTHRASVHKGPIGDNFKKPPAGFRSTELSLVV